MAWVEGQGRRFSGKVALVTGGASGVGRAVAVALAAEGAHVVLTDPNEARGLLGITRAAAVAYASRGIRCNVVAPILGPSDADRHQAEVSGEVTRLVLWLCSGDAAFVNGEYHAVEAGLAGKHRAPLVQS